MNLHVTQRHIIILLPELAPCRLSLPDCMVPVSWMPGNRWLPGLWKSWRTYWWRRWSPGGPDTVWPQGGGSEQRTAKSSWSASRRNIKYTPPTDLERWLKKTRGWTYFHAQDGIISFNSDVVMESGRECNTIPMRAVVNLFMDKGSKYNGPSKPDSSSLRT